MIKAVLFDLDGTLLPMDNDIFVKAYFGGLAKKLAPLGYNAKELIDAVWKGTEAMLKNNGTKTNEQVFWDTFCEIFGEKAREDEPDFTEFYRTEFQKIKDCCGFDENSVKTVHNLKEKGVRVVLATNPVFPAIATESRIKWAGLNPDDFEFYTTYENSSYCKPNPKYYLSIAKELSLKPQECLMVGNDVGDDMVAKSIGMDVFLLTDNLINKTAIPISEFFNGSFKELEEYIREKL